MQTRQALKKHKCVLCKQAIPKGEEYVRERMTPWKGRENEVFYTYKAHQECDRKWSLVAADLDFRLPTCAGEWEHVTDGVTV